MILRQQVAQAGHGYWDGGAKSRFDWTIDKEFADGKSRVGSYDANMFFEVKTGKTEKLTLCNAKRHLRAITNKNNPSTFTYLEDE